MTPLLLAVAFGVLIGLSLGLVGGGGSILTVPILVYAIGQPAHIATTTSLAIVGTNALVGVVGHARAGNVLPKTGFAFGAAGFLGAIVGTWLHRQVPATVLLALLPSSCSPPPPRCCASGPTRHRPRTEKSTTRAAGSNSG